MNLAYRAGQFMRTLAARPRTHDLSLVHRHLPPPLVRLFEQMSPADQAHSVRVLQSLLARGERHPDLLAAALLHDVGKARLQPRLWERVLAVLARWLFPRQARRWAMGEPRGWRRALIIAERHPQWGGELVRQAGGAPQVVDLVRRHQDPPLPTPERETDRLLNALRAADAAN